MQRTIHGGTGRKSALPARDGASGNAMVVALLVLLLFTAAGVTFVAVTKSEKQIAGNQLSSSQAMYVAESGLTEAIARMNSAGDPSYIGPALPTPGWGRYVVNAAGSSALDPDAAATETDGLDNNGNATIDEAGERYPEVSTAQAGSPSRLQYPYVKVRYKTSGGNLVRFGDGDRDPQTPDVENLTIGAPVLEVTARGDRGTASKMIEAEAYRRPLLDVNAAIWAGGSLKLSGNALLIDGHDHEMAAPFDTVAGAAPVPGILSKGPTSTVDMSSGQEDNVLGLGETSSVRPSTYTYDFNQIWSTIAPLAQVKLPGGTSLSGSSPSIGTPTDQKIAVVDGNLSVSGSWSGSGILVVNGNLSLSGGCSYTGVVVVLGDVNITGGGPADQARIVGGLVYQGTVIDANKYAGSGRVYYSSEAVNNAMRLSRYQLAWWRER